MLPLLTALIIAMAAADAPAAAPTATTGDPPQTPPAAAAPAVVDDSTKIVCVSESEAGTLFKHKVCATKAEWKKRRQRDRDQATDALDSRTSSSSVHSETGSH